MLCSPAEQKVSGEQGKQATIGVILLQLSEQGEVGGGWSENLRDQCCCDEQHLGLWSWGLKDVAFGLGRTEL